MPDRVDIVIGMPTYVYKFIDTGETIEIQQAFSDDTLTEAVHPDTGKKMPVKKVFLPVGVTFKGDGFYKTDSRNSKSTTSKSAGSDSAGSSSSSDSSSSSSEKASASTSSSGSSDTKASPAKTAAATD